MIPKLCQSYELDFRKRQIDTLKIFNNNVVEVAFNDEYCMHFVAGGTTFLLTVQLGDHFPKESPKFIISPIVQHKWVNVNSGEFDMAPGILNYSKNSDLGRIVQEIKNEFESHPPIVVPSSSPFSVSRTNKDTTPTKTLKSLDNSKENLETHAEEHINIPNLSTLSLTDLKQLDNNPDFFNDFIEEMSVVQHLNEKLDSMINQVENISRKNESKECQLVELKRKLSDDVTTLKHLGEKCDMLNKQYLKKSEEFAPQHIRELLQIAASNSDSDCDHHVEHFLSGKIDVQTFINNYTHSKKISSERKAKEERLGHQLSALERAGN